MRENAARAPVSLVTSLHMLLIVAIAAMLACLSACGPGPTDEALSVGAAANAGGGLTPVPASRAVSVPLGTGTVPFSMVATGTGSASGTGTVADGKGDSPRTVPIPLAVQEPPLPDSLVLPEWIAKELNSPQVPVRLRALETWAQQGATATIDPLVVALDDEEEEVRAKAMAIIERQWAVEPERGSEE